MKRLNYILTILIIVAFSGCKKTLDSEGVSKTTYYPNFTMTGNATIFEPLGATFTDPGIVAKAGTETLPVRTSVVGIYSPYTGTTVDGNAANKYVISYAATNKDGFDGFATRTVYVFNTGDLVTSIEGLYKSSVVRNGSLNPQYYNLEYVMVWKTGTNTYAISDGIGGYYDLGRNYGTAYAGKGGTFTANDIPTNDFTYGTGCVVPGFGGSVTFTSLVVDPVAKTLVLKSDWNVYHFVITLTQQ